MGRSQVTDKDNLPIPTDKLLRRRIMWDTLPCNAVSTAYVANGLLPGSEEGDLIEHAASHKRINQVVPIYTELVLHSSVAGAVLGRAILESQGESDFDDSDPRIQQYMKVMQAGSIAVLANLIDSGAVAIQTGVNA